MARPTVMRCYWRAAVLAVVGFLVLSAGLLAEACRSSPASPAASLSIRSSGSGAFPADSGDVLFDSSRVHAISVSFSQADYDAMVADFRASDDKDWIAASVTIDGVTLKRVGMRLKGSSSLRGLANGRNDGPGGPVSAANPEGLPWLIRLDRFTGGQNYDGITNIVIRSNTWKTSLNEAVSLALLARSGLAYERGVAVRFTVNGKSALRLATELPDDTWMAQHFSADGALYKAKATGDYTYRGRDAEAYKDAFDQEAGKVNVGLNPVVDFLDFVNNSDDAMFNSRIADRLDLDAFATYLAMEQLIGNFDDIDGPGNNSYLYYDSATGRFTVVPWDHNLAFSGVNRGPPGKNNVLVQRCRANAEFEARYQARLTELERQLYRSGTASDILTTWVQVLRSQASDLVDGSTIETEAARISSYFQAGSAPML